MPLLIANGETVDRVRDLSDEDRIKNRTYLLTQSTLILNTQFITFHTIRNFRRRAHAMFNRNSGTDGTTHHGAQQGKAVTGSEQCQPRHLPWC
ncbi:hypothetical protein AVEN_94091-1 [Araneus ventricosus]|uniref:Uncharacterized protein n=1 Tax=Araneus ventricosus TaxID=182803 RepID=A0A4Y2TEI6_ARAVE|nr:hypothetical protein AVEN_94091-1 [Araneus ventricosus]